jgi:hypothetical protein
MSDASHSIKDREGEEVAVYLDVIQGFGHVRRSAARVASVGNGLNLARHHG